MKRLFSTIIWTALFAAPSFGQVLGMDRNGNLICESGEMGITNAVQGQEYSIDFVVDYDLIVALAFVLGTLDSSAISNVSFEYVPYPTWQTEDIRVPEDDELSSGFLTYKTPGGKAWVLYGADYTFQGTAISVLGTLTFTAEKNGCIAFGIDPGSIDGEGVIRGSALVDKWFFSVVPLSTCAPGVCEVATGVAHARTEATSWSAIKDLFR